MKGGILSLSCLVLLSNLGNCKDSSAARQCHGGVECEYKLGLGPALPAKGRQRRSTGQRGSDCLVGQDGVVYCKNFGPVGDRRPGEGGNSVFVQQAQGLLHTIFRTGFVYTVQLQAWDLRPGMETKYGFGTSENPAFLAQLISWPSFGTNWYPTYRSRAVKWKPHF